jgi:hypothetical protein
VPAVTTGVMCSSGALGVRRLGRASSSCCGVSIRADLTPRRPHSHLRSFPPSFLSSPRRDNRHYSATVRSLSPPYAATTEPSRRCCCLLHSSGNLADIAASLHVASELQCGDKKATVAILILPRRPAIYSRGSGLPEPHQHPRQLSLSSQAPSQPRSSSSSA